MRVGVLRASSELLLRGVITKRLHVPIGPKVVPFWGSYSEFYKVIPRRNYFGAYEYTNIVDLGPRNHDKDGRLQF